MFMKNATKIVVAAAVILTLALAAPAEAQRRSAMQVGPKCVGGINALFDEIAPVTLSVYEETAILYMWEEEKLARDVYIALAETWQLPIFSNIARAEQKHMDLVWKLIETYGIVHPFTGDIPGVFIDPNLAPLYSALVARGQVSLVDALSVGAEIEDLDLYDLYRILEETENDHLELVFHNLAKGSRNHLRAFVRALEAQGEFYTATIYLDQATIDAIVDAGREQRMFYNADGEPVAACGGAIGGLGMRRGMGGNGDQGTGSGSGTGECDGTGSASGECDGSGPHGGTNGGSGTSTGGGS